VHKTVYRIYFYDFWLLYLFLGRDIFLLSGCVRFKGPWCHFLRDFTTLFDPEEEGNIIFRNFGHYLPTDSVSYAGVRMYSCAKFDVPVLFILTNVVLLTFNRCRVH
jgi:hypothetical protein